MKNQVLLHPLRVDIPPGSITAILGGACSGKRTLLKFLAGHMDRNVDFDGKGELQIHLQLLSEIHIHKLMCVHVCLFCV